MLYAKILYSNHPPVTFKIEGDGENGEAEEAEHEGVDEEFFEAEAAAYGDGNIVRGILIAAQVFYPLFHGRMSGKDAVACAVGQSRESHGHGRADKLGRVAVASVFRRASHTFCGEIMYRKNDEAHKRADQLSDGDEHRPEDGGHQKTDHGNYGKQSG